MTQPTDRLRDAAQGIADMLKPAATPAPHSGLLRTAADRTPDPATAALLRTLADAADHRTDATVGLMGTVLHPAVTLARTILDTAAAAPPVDTDLRDRIEVWPLARVLAEVRCGSQDWSWEEEWANLDQRHAETGYLAKLEQQISENGITMPVLIGSDGRLWDGHHRLRIAVRLGIGYVPVELTPTTVPVVPASTDQAAVLADEVQQPETEAVLTEDDGTPICVCETGGWVCPACRTAPAPSEDLRHSTNVCPGFPESCPTIRPVPADPPTHYGGIRCGCADIPAPSEEPTP